MADDRLDRTRRPRDLARLWRMAVAWRFAPHCARTPVVLRRPPGSGDRWRGAADRAAWRRHLADDHDCRLAASCIVPEQNLVLIGGMAKIVDQNTAVFRPPNTRMSR